MGSAPHKLVDQVWDYPLFEALYGRRSRRFGLGFEMPEGPFRYRSAHAPVPLSELEEALLVGAGAGFTGLALWELPTPAPYRRRSGRTFPTTTPGGHTALFFTNDAGLYVLDHDVAASKPREIETADEREKILASYRAQRRELGRGRLDIPRRVPPLQRPRSVGFQSAGLDIVHAGVRRHPGADLADRPVRRSRRCAATRRRAAAGTSSTTAMVCGPPAPSAG